MSLKNDVRAEVHAVLLGDSIFDNAFYTLGEPDVETHLNSILAPGRVTLMAVDGSVCRDVHFQIETRPDDATHLILSAGGNDAIQASEVLWQPATSVGEGLWKVAEAALAFEKRHAALLDEAVAQELPLVVCTVYNPRFPDPLQQIVGVAGLCLWNDAIVRNASSRGVAILDLRRVCTGDEDYANDIEPSSRGGRKIAQEIARILEKHDFCVARSTIYPLI